MKWCACFLCVCVYADNDPDVCVIKLKCAILTKQHLKKYGSGQTNG